MKFLNTTLTLENLYIMQDANLDLIVIIAIDNTKNGPALGGCRFVAYDSIDSAILDAIKLARAMTYKSAMAELPLGGGKSVIIANKNTDRRKIFEKYGQFVNELNGRYITACDSGTDEKDMQIIASQTKYVTSHSSSNTFTDDNTPYMTALGVVKSIEAAANHKFGNSDLKGLHIAIQGIGNVGYHIMNMLLEKSASLTISDTNESLLKQRTNGILINVVNPKEILTAQCDVFVPCALGGIIDEEFVQNQNTKIICGAANNQLSNKNISTMLLNKNVLYVPDYVANAGGLICCAMQAGLIPRDQVLNRVNKIYNRVTEVLNDANKYQITTDLTANRIAEERFN